MGDDDRQLLVRTHRGHEASARLLWQRHAPGMLAHAGSILRDRAAAEDAVQAVMCRLIALPGGQIRAINDVGAYLAGAVRREALNQIRSTRRARAREAAAATKPLLEEDRSDALREALGRLPRRLREVVVLRHLSDLTFDQMALAMETNRNTVASRYRAAVAALQDLLTLEKGAAHA